MLAREAIQTKGLTVVMQWRTHGRGNTNKGPESEVKLFEGEWAAGERNVYSFELVAPAGPASYHGTLVNLDHYVSAAVVVGWSVDTRAETEVLVAPPAGASEYDFGPSHRPSAVEVSNEDAWLVVGSVLAAGCFGLPGLGLLPMSIAVALGKIGTESGARLGPAVGTALMGLLFAGLGFGAALHLQKRRVARRKLGTPLVELSRTEASRGDRVDLKVTLQPPGAVQLNGAVASFRGRERAMSGVGTSDTTYTHDFHADESGLGAPPRLEAGQSLTLRASFLVPSDAAPTFVSMSNAVRWIVTVKIGVAGWPDWEREIPITVRP